MVLNRYLNYVRGNKDVGGGMRQAVLSVVVILAASLLAYAAWAGSERTLLLVYEDKPNSDRYLGSGTAIPWEKPGLSVDLIVMTARRLGVTLKLQRMPWKRCKYMVQHGLAQGMFHTSYDEARSRYSLYPMKNGKPDPSRAMFTQSYYFYATKSDHVQWDGVELRNMGGRPVGIAMGYSIAKDLERLGLRSVEFMDQETCLVSLVEGRVAAIADLGPMTDPVIQANSRRFQAVRKLEPPLKTKPYYLVFSRRLATTDPGLPDLFWKTMKDVERSEAFRERAKLYRQ